MGDIVLDRQMLGKPREKFWLLYIRKRIAQNKNFLAIVSGATGSGKSWSCLSIAEDLDKEFNVSRVVFSPLELMNLINGGELHAGSVIVLEEVGVSLNNRNWQSVVNKMINYLMQTFRHRSFILLLNAPFADFVDTATRKLLHAEIATAGIDYKTGETKLKPLLLQYNGKMRKFYYKRLRVITAEGNVPVSFWKVHKPSEELIKAYEKKKREFTDNLNREILEELTKTQNKGRDTELTDVQGQVLALLREGKNIEGVAQALGRAKGSVYASINLIKKKGYNLKAVFEGRRLVSYEVIEPEKSRSSI